MFPLPLRVTLNPSRQLRLWLAGLHMVAGLALWLADLPMTWQGAGTVLLAASLAYYRRPGTSVALRGKSDGNLELQREGDWEPIELLPDSLVLPALTVLRYRVPGERRVRTAVILADSLPGEDFRRLRVWVRWLGGKDVSIKRPRPAN